MYFNNYYFNGQGPFDFSDMELSELLRQNNRIQKRMNELEIMYENIENLDDLEGLSREIGELKQFSEDIKDEIAGMYTQQEIDQELAKYYTKEEVDMLFNELPEFDIETYYTRAEVDSLISTIEPPEDYLVNYYTKNEVDGKIAGLDFDVDLDPYVTDDELQAALENIDNDVDLGNYYTKTETYTQSEVDGLIENITPGEGGEVDLSDYYNKQEVDSLIDNVETGGGGTGGGVSIHTIRRMHPDANIIYGKMPEDIDKWTNMEALSSGANLNFDTTTTYNIETYDELYGDGIIRMSIDTSAIGQTISNIMGGEDPFLTAEVTGYMNISADITTGMDVLDGLFGDFSFSEIAEENRSFYTIEFPMEGWFENPGNGGEIPLNIIFTIDTPENAWDAEDAAREIRNYAAIKINWIEYRMPESFHGYSPPIA